MPTLMDGADIVQVHKHAFLVPDAGEVIRGLCRRWSTAVLCKTHHRRL